MNRKLFLALVGAVVIGVAGGGVAAAATSSGPAVSVQIKSTTKTLAQVVVHGEKGWITKGGTPRGKCSGKSAAGALDAATHGKWTGKYYSSVPGIFITSIMGVAPKGSHFWGLFVNGKSSSKGICDVSLHAGEKLLFKITK
jgi:Domain of unknown function (DUF4430)